MRKLIFTVAAVLLTGCNVNVSGPTESLLAVTGRTIPPGSALAFPFTPEAGREVSIGINASTDAAEPLIQVVRGTVDYEDLQTTPIADLVNVRLSLTDGQASGRFTPDAGEPHTLFITDQNNIPGATFSVSITQVR